MTQKKQLRQQMLHVRREKNTALQAPMREALQNLLPSLLPSPPLVVSGYFSFKEEVDLMPLMHTLYEKGYAMGLPVVVAAKKPLLFRQWTPETNLEKRGAYRIPEPPPSSPMLVPDIVLTPLAAFDRRGHRIGFGAGFYDRTLAQLRQQKKILVIGIAFSFQEIPEVPIEPTDEALDWIITEKEHIICKA